MRLRALKPEDIEPTDAKMSTADAKKIFRQFMLLTNFIAKEEIAEHTRWFVKALREHEEMAKVKLDGIRDNWGPCIEDTKVDIQDLQRELREETDAVAREELQAELKDAKRELVERSQIVKKAEEECRALREDRRAFLVDYINRMIQR